MSHDRIKEEFSFCHHSPSLSDIPFLTDVSSVLDSIPHSSFPGYVTRVLKTHTIVLIFVFVQAISISNVSKGKPSDFKFNLE